MKTKCQIKQMCQSCKGIGQIIIPGPHGSGGREFPCPMCNGRGFHYDYKCIITRTIKILTYSLSLISGIAILVIKNKRK